MLRATQIIIEGGPIEEENKAIEGNAFLEVIHRTQDKSINKATRAVYAGLTRDHPVLCQEWVVEKVGKVPLYQVDSSE